MTDRGYWGWVSQALLVFSRTVSLYISFLLTLNKHQILNCKAATWGPIAYSISPPLNSTWQKIQHVAAGVIGVTSLSHYTIIFARCLSNCREYSDVDRSLR